MIMIKIKFLIPILIVILVLGTISALLATKTWDPAWNPFRKIPSRIIENAITKLTEAESFKFEGEIGGEFQTTAILKTITVSISSSGLIDRSDKDKSKTSIALDLSLGMEGLIIQMKGEIITLAKDIYLKITSLPALPFLTEEFLELKNQWLKIDPEKLKELTETEDEELLVEEEFIEDIKILLADKEVFKVKKNLGDEELDGVRVEHYLAGFKKETMKVLIPEFFQLMKKYIPEKERANYEKDLEEFSKNFSENFDEIWKRITPLEFNFWIEKRNSWLRKIKFEKEIIYDSPETGEETRIKLEIDLNFSDFNKKFEIKSPENYKLIEEILQD